MMYIHTHNIHFSDMIGNNYRTDHYTLWDLAESSDWVGK